MANLFRGLVAGQQLRTVINAHYRTFEATATGAKIVPGLSPGVGRPCTPLRVVGEAAIQYRELIQVVGSGGIVARRNSDAHTVAASKDVLSQQPAMRLHVPLRDDVA